MRLLACLRLAGSGHKRARKQRDWRRTWRLERRLRSSAHLLLASEFGRHELGANFQV